MKISDLAGPEIALPDAVAATDVTGIASDSRKVKPGDLFVALSGTKADGSAFVAAGTRPASAGAIRQALARVAAS